MKKYVVAVVAVATAIGAARVLAAQGTTGTAQSTAGSAQTGGAQTPATEPARPAIATGKSTILQKVIVKVNGEIFAQSELEFRQIQTLRDQNRQVRKGGGPLDRSRTAVGAGGNHAGHSGRRGGRTARGAARPRDAGHEVQRRAVQQVARGAEEGEQARRQDLSRSAQAGRHDDGGPARQHGARVAGAGRAAARVDEEHDADRRGSAAVLQHASERVHETLDRHVAGNHNHGARRQVRRRSGDVQRVLG